MRFFSGHLLQFAGWLLRFVVGELGVEVVHQLAEPREFGIVREGVVTGSFVRFFLHVGLALVDRFLGPLDCFVPLARFRIRGAKRAENVGLLKLGDFARFGRQLDRAGCRAIHPWGWSPASTRSYSARRILRG